MRVRRVPWDVTDGRAASSGWQAHDRSFGLLNPVDLLLLAGVPIVLLGVFVLPLQVREQLVFEVTDPTVLDAYVSHYVHLDQSHLFGFSGINAALFGLLTFVLVSYVSTHLSSSIDESDAPALLFFMLSLITVIAVPSRAWMEEITLVSVGIGLIYVVALLLCVGVPDWRSIVDGWGGGRAEIALIGAGVLLLFPFVGFHQTFTGDGGVYDLYAHFLGYALAFIVMYIVTVTVD